MTQNLDRFKFRAWDKEWIESPERMYSDYPKCFGINSLAESKRFSLMQSTSLKDKNGKLIYEGDIVSIEGDTYTIVWSEDNAGFVARCRTPNHPEYDIYGFCDVEMEILGNIYENPEKINK